MQDRKKSTIKALESYLDRQSRVSKPTRKNQSPERDFSKEIVPYLRGLGFQVIQVESKAVFSQAAGRYMNSQAKPGTSDILACSPFGQFCAIELKAAGKARTLKEHQRDFLVETISRGGFAACVDSIECFASLWSSWSNSPNKEMLVAALPKTPSGANTERPLFD
jgi:hypothetical protein